MTLENWNILTVMYESIVGTNVASIQKDVNILFRSVSNYMHNAEDKHSEIK